MHQVSIADDGASPVVAELGDLVAELEQQRHEIETLRVALETNRTTATALGIVMERYGLDEQRAFDYLKRLSQSTNTKLREIAERIVHPPDDATPGDGPASTRD